MDFFEQLTRERYKYNNKYSSFKFIDFMNTDMVGELGVVGDKDNENTIRQIIRSVFSYRRYEPSNPYVYHKVVPSARNIHPNEAFLIEKGQISRFNSKVNLFENIAFNSHYSGRIWVVIISELWRIMKFYGDFGLALSLLDAGHIRAHLKLKLIAAGYSKALLIEGEDRTRLIRDIGFSDNSACIASIIDLSYYLKQEDSENLITKDSQVIIQAERKFNYEKEVYSYPKVVKFIQRREIFGESPITYGKESKKLCGVLEYELARNSGHSMLGLFSTIDRLPLDSVMEYAKGIAAYIKQYLGDRTGLYACLLHRDLDGEDNLIYVSAKGIEKRRKIGKAHRESLLHDTFEHINIYSIPLNVFIIYETDPSCSQETNIRNSHMGAGEISQYISLLVARDRLFSRPMKNFNDRNVARLINIDGDRERVIYSTIIGRDNCFNYVLKL